MSNSNDLILYTLPNCEYCTQLKVFLDTLDRKYITLDISQNKSAKAFIKSEGHTTVPQLYYGAVKINNIPTDRITPEYLDNSIKLLEDIGVEAEEWPWEDSGIEQGNL